MTIVIRVCRRAPVWDSSRLSSVLQRTQPALNPMCFHPTCAWVWARRGTLGELIKPLTGGTVDFWKNDSFEDLQAVLLKSSPEHSVTDAMEGHVSLSEGLLLGSAFEQDFSLWAP